MERGKVIFNSNTAFSLYNFRLGLMRELKEKGFQVYAVAPYDKYAEALRSEFEFFQVRRLDRKGKNPLKDLSLLFEYISLFRRIKPDLVINYTIKPNIYGSIACGILGIRSISVVTGLGYVFARGGFLEKLVRFLYRLALRFNSYVIVQNSEDETVIKNIAHSKKVLLIKGSGVNVDRFSPLFCESSKDSKLIFLFIGRYLRNKGVLELVEASKSLIQDGFDFELHLVGAPDYGNPESLTKDELDRIKKLPFVRVFDFAEDVRPFICNSDCVVLPSYYREGIPRVLLEAMSMGKPIITTDAPGCREVVVDGVNGYMVKQKDIDSLKEAMKRFLLLSEKSRKTMGKKGRQMVLEGFDERIIISRYIEVISEVLSSGR